MFQEKTRVPIYINQWCITEGKYKRFHLVTPADLITSKTRDILYRCEKCNQSFYTSPLDAWKYEAKDPDPWKV